MAALIPKRNIQYFSNEEKQQVIYEYIDKLIILFPDFEYFRLHDYCIELEPDFKERKKLYNVISEVRTTMERLEYIEVPPKWNALHTLTEKGRLVKSKGGYFNYLKSIEPKTDWYKIIPIILSIVFGISMAVIGVLNYKLNKDKDRFSIEKEQLNKQIDSLKEKIKILENKEK